MTAAADARFGTPPTLGLKEAAVQCGVSVSTMRRHRDELVKLGATVSDQGHWSIPIPALITVGLMDRRTAPDALVGVVTPPVTPTVTPDYLDRIAQLERQLQDEIMARKDEHAGRVLAEQVAAERERIIQAQAQTLRILEAAPSVQPAVTPPQEAEQPASSVEPEPVAPSSSASVPQPGSPPKGSRFWNWLHGRA